MEKIVNSEVLAVFNSYPEDIRNRLFFLRQLIYETAFESKDVGVLEETIKWGEPSYLVKGGSTIRIAWKKLNPDQYAIYFNCKTKLVDTFKEIYRDKLCFEGNRAIVFYKNDELPVEEIEQCILLALTYHARKNKPLLGM